MTSAEAQSFDAERAGEPLVRLTGIVKHLGRVPVLRGVDLEVWPGEVDLADQGMTMIIVTHEIGFARDVADRVLFMDGGVVIETGPPQEVLNNPKNQRTREFLSRVLH